VGLPARRHGKERLNAASSTSHGFHLWDLFRVDHHPLAWVTGHQRITDRTRWLLLGLLAAATSYEVAWVVLQHARGTPAHFNDTTPWTSGCSSPGR
jgi:hypothetical protein